MIIYINVKREILKELNYFQVDTSNDYNLKYTINTYISVNVKREILKELNYFQVDTSNQYIDYIQSSNDSI